MPSTYPQRPSGFVYKLDKLMWKAMLAQRVGPEVCWLIKTIGVIEDNQFYHHPVRRYNEQLMIECGIATAKTLDRVRQAAIDAGWLHYEPGGKGVPGTYWVTIPEAAVRADDIPPCQLAAGTPTPACAAEPTDGSLPLSGGSSAVASPLSGGSLVNFTQQTEKEPPSKGRTEEPIPRPIPRPKPRKKKPPADAGCGAVADAGSKPGAGGTPEPVPRPRDELFDAIVALTGADPKVAGGRIARVKKQLLAADPPYTAAEILRLDDPAFRARHLPFLGGERVSFNLILDKCGLLRAAGSDKPPTPTVPPGRHIHIPFVAKES